MKYFCIYFLLYILTLFVYYNKSILVARIRIIRSAYKSETSNGNRYGMVTLWIIFFSNIANSLCRKFIITLTFCHNSFCQYTPFSWLRGLKSQEMIKKKTPERYVSENVFTVGLFLHQINKLVWLQRSL